MLNFPKQPTSTNPNHNPALLANLAIFSLQLLRPTLRNTRYNSKHLQLTFQGTKKYSCFINIFYKIKRLLFLTPKGFDMTILGYISFMGSSQLVDYLLSKQYKSLYIRRNLLQLYLLLFHLI